MADDINFLMSKLPQYDPKTGKAAFMEDTKSFEDSFTQEWNALKSDVVKYNKQWSFLQSRKKGKELRDRANRLIEFAGAYQDPTKIQKHNDQWLKTEIARLKEEGGDRSGTLINQAYQVHAIASQEGARIAFNKVKLEAHEDLNALQAEYKQKLAEGDIQGAKDLKFETEAFLNNAEAEEIFSKEEAKAFKGEFKNISADQILFYQMQQAQFIDMNENTKQAQKYINDRTKENKGFFNDASTDTKTKWLKLQKLLNQSVQPKYYLKSPKRKEEAYNTIENYLQNFNTTSEQAFDAIDTAIAAGKKDVKNAKTPPQREKAAAAIKEFEFWKHMLGEVKKAENIAVGKEKGDIFGIPLFNPRLSDSDIAKAYGITGASNGMRIIASIRNNLYTKNNGDPIGQKIALYAKLSSMGGAERLQTNPTQNFESFRSYVAEEKQIAAKMGYPSVMSSYSKELYKQYLTSDDANTRAQAKDFARKDPALYEDMLKADSKPSNIVTSKPNVDFINEYSVLLNMDSQDIVAAAKIMDNVEYASSNFNQIFSVINERIAAMPKGRLQAFARRKGVPSEVVAQAVSLSIWKEFHDSGTSHYTMNQGLSKGDKSIGGDIRDRVITRSDQILNGVYGNVKLKNNIDISSAPKMTETDNPVIDETYGFFGKRDIITGWRSFDSWDASERVTVLNELKKEYSFDAPGRVEDLIIVPTGQLNTFKIQIRNVDNPTGGRTYEDLQYRNAGGDLKTLYLNMEHAPDKGEQRGGKADTLLRMIRLSNQ